MSELSRNILLKYLISVGAIASLVCFIPAGMSQENPLSVRDGASKAQVKGLRQARSPKKVADARLIAAASPTRATSLGSSTSGVVSEEDWIRQLSGQSVVPAQKATATRPIGVVPVTAVSDAQLLITPPQAAKRSPLLLTAAPNADVSLPLVELRSPQEYRFTTPSSPIRNLSPDPFIEQPRSLLPPAPPSAPVQTKDEILAQSSRYDAGSLQERKGTRSLMRSTALTAPELIFQGVYVHQGDQSSARARLTGTYPLSPNALVGATLDVVTGKGFTDTPDDGFNLTELYAAFSPRDIPNLRFVVGQLDLTSYFDRNSFAKDGASHFFNPVFQTNPALSATGIASRPGALVNFSLTDNIEAKAAFFSSSKGLSDFALDGFAGEVGIRQGNLIVRGTYATDRDAGSKSGFGEVFSLARGNNQFGVLRGDREESYGVNAEVFVPSMKMGVFGRYGRYNNVDLGRGGDTFSGGVSFFDLFNPDDRLGLAYGRGLSNDGLRFASNTKRPDVLEMYYDFRFLQNLRVGFSVQGRNEFSEVAAGIRVKTEFDVTPRGRQVQ